jgi:cbb3-type cytochrome oxidase subunit 3
MRFSPPGTSLHRKSRPSPQFSLSGTSHFALLVVMALFFVTGGVYIFAVNERAVYGYDIRALEKELATLKKQNAELRLREAEGRSLSRVETGSVNLRMEKAVPVGELIIGKPGSVAYR